jgi:hypothetical protein
MRLMLWFALVAALSAQENRGPQVYRVDFTIRDAAEAAAKAPRRYSMLIEAGQANTSVRSGNRIPLPVGQNTQYHDVGVNIDCRLRESGDKVTVYGTVEVSAVNPGPAPNSAGLPVIASLKSSLTASVTPGKPTVLTSFDDPLAKSRFEVEVLVAPVK